MRYFASTVDCAHSCNDLSGGLSDSIRSFMTLPLFSALDPLLNQSRGFQFTCILFLNIFALGPDCLIAINQTYSKPACRRYPITSDTTWCPTYVIRLEPSFKDRKSTRLNSSHMSISYAVFCLK